MPEVESTDVGTDNVKREIEWLIGEATEAYEEGSGVEKNLTTKLNVAQHARLELMALATKRSKSSLASNLLEKAVLDAWSALLKEGIVSGDQLRERIVQVEVSG